MIAVWILLGIAVLFGGGIFAVVLYAIRHDDSAARTAADGHRSPQGEGSVDP